MDDEIRASEPKKFILKVSTWVKLIVGLLTIGGCVGSGTWYFFELASNANQGKKVPAIEAVLDQLNRVNRHNTDSLERINEAQREIEREASATRVIAESNQEELIRRAHDVHSIDAIGKRVEKNEERIYSLERKRR